jgi:hypothetical protein
MIVAFAISFGSGRRKSRYIVTSGGLSSMEVPPGNYGGTASVATSC